MSVISQVSTIEGCPLSGVPLYCLWLEGAHNCTPISHTYSTCQPIRSVHKFTCGFQPMRVKTMENVDIDSLRGFVAPSIFEWLTEGE